MKLHSFIVACMAIAIVATSCKESRILPGDNSHNQDTIYVVPPMDDPTDSATVAALASVPDSLLINVTEARDICATLGNGESTPGYYYVKGWICSQNIEDNATAIKKYGNVYFHMGRSKYSETRHALYAYQILGLDKKKLLSTESVQVGDFVIVKCHLTNYSNVFETVGQGDGNIYYSTNPDITKRPESIDVTCAEAKEIALNLPADDQPTDEYYCVTGYITNVSGSVSKGQQTFWMDDKAGTTKTLQAYWANVPDGVTPFQVGQKVKLYGNLMRYKGTTAELKNGDVEFITE